MNVTLLRAARRYRDGTRSWSIPGAPNAAKLIPTGKSFWQTAPSFSWPHQQPNGDWIMRSVRLDWHRSIAKAGARELIATYEAPL